METIRKGTQKKSATILLQELLRKAGYDLSSDGIFGPGTDKAGRSYLLCRAIVVELFGVVSVDP